MTSRLIRMYLRDRAGVIATTYSVAVVLLVLVALLLSYQNVSPGLIRANTGYGLLLTTLILCVFLICDLLRRLPFIAQTQRLLGEQASSQELGCLPEGSSAEQEAMRALVTKVHRESQAELERVRDLHRRQLTFMRLWVHQMKTPVAALSLVAQRGQDTAEPAARAAMAAVEEETTKLAEGLDMVLTMARMEEFSADYHVRRVDLLASLRQVINGRKRQFIRFGIFPEVEAADADWTVLTDEKWNGVVIDQIIANAIKYASQGGSDDSRLTCRLVRTADNVTLAITDYGPGIPPEDLPRVFEPFFTGANGRRFGGATGIGLYIAKEVCDSLGQGIEISSRSGFGTTVTISYKSPDDAERLDGLANLTQM